MTDSVTCNLLDRDGRIISLYDLPAEMLQTIVSYCCLLPLMRLSTTCIALRYNVHEVFTSRISDQAAKYPEVKQSLDTLGWRKKTSGAGSKVGFGKNKSYFISYHEAG